MADTGCGVVKCNAIYGFISFLAYKNNMEVLSLGKILGACAQQSTAMTSKQHNLPSSPPKSLIWLRSLPHWLFDVFFGFWVILFWHAGDSHYVSGPPARGKKSKKWRDADATAGQRMVQKVLTVVQSSEGIKLYYSVVRPRHRRDLRDEHESLALWHESVTTKHKGKLLSRPPEGRNERWRHPTTSWLTISDNVGEQCSVCDTMVCTPWCCPFLFKKK